MPPLDHLNTAFLAALRSAGVDRSAVDVVINTHIHSDHVGWNTMADGDAWVPTFPNARYWFPPPTTTTLNPTDPRHNSRRAPKRKPPSSAVTNWCSRTACYPSTRPDSSSNGPTTTRSASRWTPGRPRAHPRLLGAVAGRERRAVFVGDLTHSPLQLRLPDDPCAFDIDGTAAAVTRRRVLTEAAQAKVAVVPAHYPGSRRCNGPCRRGQFEIDHWLDIEPLHRR